jgi:hypothetical protein
VQRRRDKVFTPCAEQGGEGEDEVQVASVEGKCGGGSMCARLKQGRETPVAGRRVAVNQVSDIGPTLYFRIFRLSIHWHYKSDSGHVNFSRVEKPHGDALKITMR